jgi:hypothetical protein
LFHILTDKEGKEPEEESVTATDATVSEASKELEGLAMVEAVAESVAETVVITAVAEAVAATPEKGCAPDVKTPLKDKTLKVGGVIKLTIVIKDAVPSATVRWFKDGEDITENGVYFLP